MATQAASVVSGGRSKIPARSGYFFWVSVLLLVIVLIGFAPTLYLRALFPQPLDPNMPLYLYVHGAVLTAWFVWMANQTWLVRSGRTALHRRMGWIGAVLAAGVCITGPMAAIGVVGRLKAQGLDFDTDMSMNSIPNFAGKGMTMFEFASPFVWGNLVIIAVFAGLVGSAILLRKRAEYHKRLMLLASLGLMAPALARIPRLPIFGDETNSLLLPLLGLVGLGLLLSPTCYDLFKYRNPCVGPAKYFSTLPLSISKRP